MANLLLLAALLLAQQIPPAPVEGVVVEMDGEVITGNHLPKYATLCEDAPVYGAPYEGQAVLYTLPAGTRVRIYEQMRGGLKNYAMIETANWVKLTAFCFARRQ